MNTPPKIHVECHPPERGPRSTVALYGCGCTCCCCCCLHTLGGLIGSALAPGLGRGAPPAPTWYREDEFVPPPPPPRITPGGEAIRTDRARFATERDKSKAKIRPKYDEDVFDLRQPSSISSVALFWYMTLALSVLAVIIGGVVGQGGGLLMSLFLLILGFPAVQLVSAILVFLVIAVSPRSDRSYQAIQLTKITVGLIIGTVAGVGAMFLIAAMFR